MPSDVPLNTTLRPLGLSLHPTSELLDTHQMHLQFLVALVLLAHSALAANNFYGIGISSFNSNGQCRNAGPSDGRRMMIATKVRLLFVD